MEPGETSKLIGLQTCLHGIKTWMTINFLLLNSDKTEIVVFGPEDFRNRLPRFLVTLDGITLASSTPVRNLGVNFDQDLSFKSQIKCMKRFLELPSLTFERFLK